LTAADADADADGDAAMGSRNSSGGASITWRSRALK
jgi:hypothetical protein